MLNSAVFFVDFVDTAQVRLGLSKDYGKWMQSRNGECPEV